MKDNVFREGVRQKIEDEIEIFVYILILADLLQ